MRSKLGCLLFVGLAVSAGRANAAEVYIKEIVTDDHISGTVSGVNLSDLPNYCVVIYVHTDTWYIHPNANEGDGKSWAGIKTDGTWQIETIKRDHPADKMAALVLKKNSGTECDAPAKVSALSAVPRQQGVTTRVLKGTQDYGSL